MLTVAIAASGGLHDVVQPCCQADDRAERQIHAGLDQAGRNTDQLFFGLQGAADVIQCLLAVCHAHACGQVEHLRACYVIQCRDHIGGFPLGVAHDQQAVGYLQDLRRARSEFCQGTGTAILNDGAPEQWCVLVEGGFIDQTFAGEHLVDCHIQSWLRRGATKHRSPAAGHKEIDCQIEQRDQLCRQRLHFIDDDDAVAQAMKAPHSGHLPAEERIEQLHEGRDDDLRVPGLLQKFSLREILRGRFVL